MPRVAANTIPMINPASMASRRTIIRAPAMQIPLCFQAWHSLETWPMLASRHRRWRGQVAENQAPQRWVLHHHGLTINKITFLRTIKNYSFDSLTYAILLNWSELHYLMRDSVFQRDLLLLLII